jgi:hypothetical protein
MTERVAAAVRTLAAEIERDTTLSRAPHDLLPVYSGWAGYLALSPAGDIVFINSEATKDFVEPVTELLWITVALVNAAARHPELAELLPGRPVGRPDCEQCGGLGVVDVAAHRFGCRCGGLGWVPESPSELGVS